jgi:hypothetical protein
VSHIGGSEGVPGPGTEPVDGVPSVRELSVRRAIYGVHATPELLSPAVAFPPGAGVREAPTVGTSVVPELRAPRAGYRVGAANGPSPSGAVFPPVNSANKVLRARTSVVPELPAPSPPWASMLLPASFGEMLRYASQWRPGAPPAPVAPLEPNPGVNVVPRPAIPPVAGAELDRLAEKVSRVIARRVAVERERRGR